MTKATTATIGSGCTFHGCFDCRRARGVAALPKELRGTARKSKYQYGDDGSRRVRGKNKMVDNLRSGSVQGMLLLPGRNPGTAIDAETVAPG